MTLTAHEFAEVKRIGQALDHLVNAVEEVGIQIQRVADAIEAIQSATVEEINPPSPRCGNSFPTTNYQGKKSGFIWCSRDAGHDGLCAGYDFFTGALVEDPQLGIKK